VDEFQNLITDTFAGLLSESRKYGLGVHLTNQYFAQLPEKIQNAILGNAGTMIAFEIGVEDAERLSREFYPMTKQDFLSLPRFNFYIKLMIDGKTSETFSGVSLPPAGEASSENPRQIRLLNQLAYAIPKKLADEQIRNYIR